MGAAPPPARPAAGHALAGVLAGLGFIAEPFRAFLRRFRAKDFLELRLAGDRLARGEGSNGILDGADDVATLVARLRRRGANRLRDQLGARRAEAAPREEAADSQPGFVPAADVGEMPSQNHDAGEGPAPT